jgi:hypothetical protein
MLASLESDHAQQMQALGVLRLYAEQLPIASFRLRQSPRAMRTNRPAVDRLQRRIQRWSLCPSCLGLKRRGILRGNGGTSPRA